MARQALCIIPTFLRTDADLDVVLRCLKTLVDTAPEAAALVLDDHSPNADLAKQLEVACSALGIWFDRRPSNEGFSRTVNVGLAIAEENDCDAILVNADIEFIDAGWVGVLQAREDSQGRPAAVVGARLLYPSGLLQHAGVSYSLLWRGFYHRHQFGPSDLAEALVPRVCPVTAALQLIRLETLRQIGIYDEGYRMAWEDMDYCLRVFEAGLECVYEPAVRAWHMEKTFRSRPTGRQKRWFEESSARLVDQWAGTDLSRFVEPVL